MLNITPILAKEATDHVVPWNLHLYEKEGLFSWIGFGQEDFFITNQMVMAVISAILLVIVMFLVTLRVAKKGHVIDDYITKGAFAQLFEVICEFIRNEIARPALGKSTDKYIYYIWTTFFFIIFCNLMGLFPLGSFLATIDYIVVGGEVTEMNKGLNHWSATATGNFWIVAALSLVAFLMIHISGIREAGFKHWFMHFLPGPFFLWPLMFILEIVGALIKPFALTIRLFANMVAGHLILAALMGIILTFKWFAVPFAVPGAVAITFLEIFVATMQAYLFTFLTVLFMSAFLHHDDEHEHEEHDEAPGMTAEIVGGPQCNE